MHSAPFTASDSPESLSQAGAGALVLSFALVDLWLAFWGAGWWHRCGASLVALIGAVLLVRGLAALAAPHWAELVRRNPRVRRARRIGLDGAMLAEFARR